MLGEIEPATATASAAPAAAEEPRRRRRRRGGEPVDVAFPEMGDSVAEGTILEWRVKPSATRSPSTTRSSRSRPTRWTPRCPRRWPARSPRSSSSGRDRARRLGPVPDRRREPAAANGPVQPTAEPTEAPSPAAEAPADERRQRHPGGRAHRERARPGPARHPGTGPRGRVTKEDVLAAVEGNGAPAPAAAPPTAAESSPSAAPRRRSCKFMNESRSIPTATSFRTLPVDALDAPAQGAQGAPARSSRSRT